jgi:hypothetical protein
VAVTVAALAVHAGAQVPQSRTGDWLADLRDWAEAVEAHTPGIADAPAFVIGAWSTAEISAVVSRLAPLAARLSRSLTSRDGRRTLEIEGRRVDPETLQQVLQLSDLEAQRGDLTRLLTRGAMLHADIAMRLEARDGRLRSMLVADGRYQGVSRQSDHWSIGRTLIDLITPSPAASDLAVLWTRATAAHLLSRLDYAESVPHLQWARARFPDEASLALDSGRLQEIFGSARIQTAARSVAVVTGLHLAVSSTATHLKAAEPLFRRAVQLQVDLTEARVRLGRALALTGRPAEAVTQLEGVEHETTDARLLYLAHLFLGDAHQALGHRDAAAASYRVAASLFPEAQSPLLALAQLARRYGERQSALRAIGDVLGLPADLDRRQDPWWTYFELPRDSADALVRELCARVADEAPR